MDRKAVSCQSDGILCKVCEGHSSVLFHYRHQHIHRCRQQLPDKFILRHILHIMLQEILYGGFFRSFSRSDVAVHFSGRCIIHQNRRNAWKTCRLIERYIQTKHCCHRCIIGISALSHNTQSGFCGPGCSGRCHIMIGLCERPFCSIGIIELHGLPWLFRKEKESDGDQQNYPRQYDAKPFKKTASFHQHSTFPD